MAPRDSNSTSGSERLAEALAAEEQLDFASVFRVMVGLSAEMHAPVVQVHDCAVPDPLTDGQNELSLFQAVRSLERAEGWRLITALWEYIGDRFDSRTQADPERIHLFDGKSLPVEFWRDPRSDDKNAGYYVSDSDPGRVKRDKAAHVRALAYGHGAEEAAANHRFALATLLRRKAGLAWTLSSWGDRPATIVSDDWIRRDVLDVAGMKWREAARSFFRAALFESRASSDDEKGLTFESYTPGEFEEQRWPRHSDEARCWPVAGDADGSRFFFETHSDVDRLAVCWKEWAKARTRAFSESTSKRTRWFVRWHMRRCANERLSENLSALEDASRAAGRGAQARSLFRRRRIAVLRASSERLLERLAASACPRDVTWPKDELADLPREHRGRIQSAGRALVEAPVVAVQWLYYGLTRSGTSILGTITSLVAVFACVVPAVFLSSNALAHCTSPTSCTRVAHRYFDNLRFVVGQALTVPPSDLAPRTAFGHWVAVLDTLTAAFAIGYSIWVITRQSL